MKRYVHYLLTIIWVAVTTEFKCNAEIPFEQAKGIYEGTKDEMKPYSPFWGMVALHGRMLEWIRFFGSYDVETKTVRVPGQEPVTTTHVVPRDKNDHIATLLLKLFPSPDGIQFVPNTRQGDPFGALSRHLSKINEIIQILLSGESNAKKTKLIADSMREVDPGISDNDYLNFGKTLAQAYDRQGLLANPARPEKQLYPGNIVITALLAFYVKVADDKTQIKNDLPFLMKNDFDAQSKFSLEEYIQHLVKEKEYLDDLILDREHPELSFLLAKGFEAYESPFASPLTYRPDTRYNNSEGFPDCGETSWRNVITLFLSANSAGIVQPEAITTFKERLMKFNPGLNLDAHEPFTRMISFFEDYPNITGGATREAHNAWSQVVSNLNQGQPLQTLNDVQYGRKLDEQGPEIYEIKAGYHPDVRGIVNMLNVTAKLIPDEVLNENWDPDPATRKVQVGKKLYRLCALFSRENLELGWSSKPGKVGDLFEYATITFKANGGPIFDWEFLSGHFQLKVTASAFKDWRTRYGKDEKFLNEWIASLFRRDYQLNTDTRMDTLPSFPLSLIYREKMRNLTGTQNAIKFVMLNKMKAFEPLIKRWVETTFYVNDIHGLSRFVQLFYDLFFVKRNIPLNRNHQVAVAEGITGYRQFFTAHKFPPRYIEAMDGSIISKLISENQLDVFKYLVAENVINVRTKDFNGRTLLQTSCYALNKDFITYLVTQGVNPSETEEEENCLNLVLKSIVEKTNIQVGREHNLEIRNYYRQDVPHQLKPFYDLLIDAGGKELINKGDKNGCTPACHAAKTGHVLVLQSLINDYGANVESRDEEGCSVLCQAVKAKDVAMVKTLVEDFKADVTTFDNYKYTPLRWIIFLSSKEGGSGGNLVEKDDQLKIITMLVQQGAYVDAPDRDGSTPQDYLNQLQLPRDFAEKVKSILEGGKRMNRQRS